MRTRTKRHGTFTAPIPGVEQKIPDYKVKRYIYEETLTRDRHVIDDLEAWESKRTEENSRAKFNLRMHKNMLAMDKGYGRFMVIWCVRHPNR